MTTKTKLSKSDSNRAAGVSKDTRPEKPRADFPLFAHASGRWCKKIKGVQRYFGPWRDPEGSLERYLFEKEYWEAGRRPPVKRDGFKVRDAVNAFLAAKEEKLNNGELSPRHFRDLHATGKRLAAFLKPETLVEDLKPADFGALRAELSKTMGVVMLGNEIQRCKSIFKFAYDGDFIPAPIRYGQSFDKPARKVVRKARNARSDKTFEAGEIRELIALAGVPLKAFILLGINCGFGQSDIAELPRKAINLKTGWLEFPRPKTGIHRRCPLWPETIRAVREAIEARPEAEKPEHDGLAFLTYFGRPWVRTKTNKEGGIIAVDSVLQEFVKLTKELKITGKGFYSLRHTFRTVADNVNDQVAAGVIMGHVDDSMADNYRHGIDGKRLLVITDHVRKWLFPSRRKK